MEEFLLFYFGIVILLLLLNVFLVEYICGIYVWVFEEVFMNEIFYIVNVDSIENERINDSLLN